MSGDTLPTGEHIEEDDPRWDCHTMGNHICGPTTTVAMVHHAPRLPDTGGTVMPLAVAGLALVMIGHRIRRWARA